MEGFEQLGPIKVYNENNIFDYLNGGAELYLASGFRLLYSQGYRNRDNGALMIVDAYDMSATGGAKKDYLFRVLVILSKGSEEMT